MRTCLSCGVLVRGGQSYCRRCDPATRRYREKRGSGWAQSRFRAQVLKRAGGRCAVCGTTVGVEAHHRVPVSTGGSHDPSNGVALCRLHHVR
jgi:predicted restriction endonuclease